MYQNCACELSGQEALLSQRGCAMLQQYNTPSAVFHCKLYFGFIFTNAYNEIQFCSLRPTRRVLLS